MSRFADATATRDVDFGACQCPGTPHESDWAKVRRELSATEISRFGNADDVEDTATIAASFVVEWNLLGEDGEPWPPSTESVLALKAPTLEPLMTAIGTTMAESTAALPNAPAAPSRGSSRGSGSQTRTTRPRR